MKKRLTVADFFCGAGGFSEGFRQKGFEVVFALDSWKPAIDTHNLNHPSCKAVLQNILELDTPEKIDALVPDVDIIIGSPPCVAFSGSNKSGKGDKSLGITLIEAYLRIIAWKKKKGTLKYWILENVPNSEKYIKQEYSWQELGLPGKGPVLEIKERVVLNAADYGAPQGRKRFFGGEFLLPKRTHSEKVLTVARVLNSLGNPSIKNRRTISDPVYGFRIPASKLTDHFYDSRVAKFEWEKARRLKVDHGFMGKMSFPEDINRPSRTVMATMSASTRESMIFYSFDASGKSNGFRTPTIREIASFMSFPISYQFEANNESSKYQLVGNAVCCKLSAALAESIAEQEKVAVPLKFLELPNNNPRINLNGRVKKNKVKKIRKFDANFSMHVPDLKLKGFRVELSNKSSNFNTGEINWECVLHHGSGKGALAIQSNQKAIFTILKKSKNYPGFKKDLDDLYKNLRFTKKSLQQQYCMNNDKAGGPYLLLNQIKRLIDKHFSEKKWRDICFDNKQRQLTIKKDFIPVRILAAFYACNHFVSKIKD